MATFVAALIAGISFWPASQFLPDGTAMVVWKGAGVALLAIWARVRARDVDGRLIAAVLGLGALGDVLLETAGLTVGALAFLAGHLVAIWLYLRHRRTVALADLALAAGLLVVTPLIAFALPADRAAAPGIALYATGLGAMAGAAWLSRFPRDRVALGALLFVISDLLIFARLGPLAGSAIPDLLVWPTYFGGQALIAWGVVSALAAKARP